MALFLPLVLAFSSFSTLEMPHYSGNMAILAGSTASAAEADQSLSGTAMLQSSRQPITPGVVAAADRTNVAEGIMETGLFSSYEPGFKGQSSGGNVSSTEGPYIPGYFSMPAKGFDWGILHPHNAVDIANACGTNIVASADGIINEESVGQWNGGYGDYILISHPNGTKTRYAHLEKVLVSVGQQVKQGELIGKMGETGNATGCHVHFEIIGAANPFAKFQKY